MKKIILACLTVLGLTVACQNEEPGLVVDALPQSLADFRNEVKEDLGLTTLQTSTLTKSLQQESANEQEPGFLWLVARHLQENLPNFAKRELLQNITDIEQSLVAQGICIPLGFEVNLRVPLHPHPGMIVPLLVPAQGIPFREIVMTHQQVAENLVTLRKAGLISPEEFHAKMQINYNSLMTNLVGGLLADEQRVQLKYILEQQAVEREQYIVQSFHLMAASLQLNAEELQKTVVLSAAIESKKNFLLQALHAGEITQEMMLQAVREMCVDFHSALDELFNEQQLEIIRIYRALSFRTRSQMACEGSNP
jgi:hypothetical protein